MKQQYSFSLRSPQHVMLAALFAYAAAAALSIAVAQLLLITMLLAWTFSRKEGVLTSYAIALSLPAGLWLVVSLLSAITGVDPARALSDWAKLAFYLLIPFTVASILREQERIRSFLVVLALSQAAAALHTIASFMAGGELWPRVPGPVTESGQLALVFPVTLGLLMTQYRFERKLSPVLLIALALQFGALVLNLKRGPWIGIMAELVLLGMLISRRLLVSALGGALLVVLLFAPVRERLLDYSDDFHISGGRQSMWALGFELSEQYPLGLGPDNARFMRQVDPTLPPSHRHMHNNLLNVAVETGWLGLIFFIWWLYVMIRIGVDCWMTDKGALGMLGLFLSTALLGWQVAGLVEYNFGDGEIRFIVFVYLGILLAIAEKLRVSPPAHLSGAGLLKGALSR